MSSSMVSGGVGDERAAGASELVVERDAGGVGEQAAGDAGAEAVEGAGAVSFEGEDVFCGPVDRFDALSDRREVRAAAGFVFAAWSKDRGVQERGVGFELSAGVALVAD